MTGYTDKCVCKGTGWVCENHDDQPWEGFMPDDFKPCCGGAGAPCYRCDENPYQSKEQ